MNSNEIDDKTIPTISTDTVESQLKKSDQIDDEFNNEASHPLSPTIAATLTNDEILSPIKKSLSKSSVSSSVSVTKDSVIDKATKILTTDSLFQSSSFSSSANLKLV